MKNTLLNLYRRDGTKAVLASLLSIVIGLTVGAVVVVIVGDGNKVQQRCQFDCAPVVDVNAETGGRSFYDESHVVKVPDDHGSGFDLRGGNVGEQMVQCLIVIFQYRIVGLAVGVVVKGFKLRFQSFIDDKLHLILKFFPFAGIFFRPHLRKINAGSG